MTRVESGEELLTPKTPKKHFLGKSIKVHFLSNIKYLEQSIWQLKQQLGKNKINLS